MHPISELELALNGYLRERGFIIESVGDVGSIDDNFDTLGVHPWFPARSYSDVCFLNSEKILKKHNTGAIYSILKERGAPCRAALLGRSFRCVTESRVTDLITFQYDGIMLDEGVSLSRGASMVNDIIHNIFGISDTRTVSKFFPYADPGFVIQGRCPDCLGRGCKRCEGKGYLNLCAYGILHPRIVGAALSVKDSSAVGFSFCFNLSKIAVLKYDIRDVHELFLF